MCVIVTKSRLLAVVVLLCAGLGLSEPSVAAHPAVATPHLDAVAFVDALHGWAAGDVILATADGGQTWRQQYPSLPAGRAAGGTPAGPGIRTVNLNMDMDVGMVAMDAQTRRAFVDGVRQQGGRRPPLAGVSVLEYRGLAQAMLLPSIPPATVQADQAFSREGSGAPGSAGSCPLSTPRPSSTLVRCYLPAHLAGAERLLSVRPIHPLAVVERLTRLHVAEVETLQRVGPGPISVPLPPVTTLVYVFSTWPFTGEIMVTACGPPRRRLYLLALESTAYRVARATITYDATTCEWRFDSPVLRRPQLTVSVVANLPGVVVQHVGEALERQAP